MSWMLANLAAMNPYLKKSRVDFSEFNPYKPKPEPIRTSDPRVLYAAFGVKPPKGEGVKRG